MEHSGYHESLSKEAFVGHDYDDDVSGLVWFLAGMGVGAAVALLFAPKTGRATRKLLARTAERGRDQLSERAEELRERGRELYERGRDLAQEVSGEAADLLERGRKIVRS